MEHDETERATEIMAGGVYTPPEAEDTDLFGQDLTKVDLGAALNTIRDNKMSKSFTGQDGAGTKAQHERSFINGYDAFDVAIPVHNLDGLLKVYNSDYTHYAAVHAKVANVVGLGYDLIESAKTMEKEDTIDEDEERLQKFRRNLRKARRVLFDRLDELNAEDEFLETLEKVVIDYEATGNGYLEIGRTQSGAIGYIGHIPSHTMRVRKKRDGFIQFVGAKPVFFRRYGDQKTRNPFNNDPNPNEIIHFKKYTPEDQYYGAPDIISALVAVAGNKYADEYNLDFFENKAVPRNLIVVRGGDFTKEHQRKLLKFFGQDLKGQHHRALYIPLPADSNDAKHDIEIKNVESGIQDSAFREYSKGNIEKILMVHRVPASKLGMTGDAALAAAKDLDKTFKEQVCRPLQRVVEKKVNRVFKEITDVFEFKLNELDLTDAVSQANIDTAYHAIGAITGNEIRARQGRPGLKNGDKTVFDIEAEQAEIGVASDARSEANSQRTNSRSRDTRRATGRTDSVGGARNPKGEGRSYT